MPHDPLLHTPDRAGILYAEDFDSPAPLPEPPELEMPEATFSSGEMEMARRVAAEDAVARARAEWEGSDAHARILALCAVAADLAAAQDEGRRLAEAAADGTVRAILGLAAGLLPAYCARHSDAEVRGLMAHLLPALQREQRITVRVGPAVADAVRMDLLSLDDDLAARVTVVAADLPPGDARVAWADGSLVRDGAAIHAAMVAALAELGLVDPNTTVPAGAGRIDATAAALAGVGLGNPNTTPLAGLGVGPNAAARAGLGRVDATVAEPASPALAGEPPAGTAPAIPDGLLASQRDAAVWPPTHPIRTRSHADAQ